MRECDLFKAVERAAFLYLFGVLINRVGKLLGKRVLAASVVLGIAVLGNQWVPIGVIIGLAVAIGIMIQGLYDTAKTTRTVIEKFRSGWWQMFKRLPQQLLNDFFLDCLNRNPECCELFQREVDNMLVEWVKGLKPGWKKKLGHGGVLKEWRRMQSNIKRRIAGLLRKCCTS
ncbi:hypothetical protein IH992_13060 [Candidatus Poribacteria bacterium]|nr:hypothetical protein [Candidatus Poribacteria bacterium]